MKAQVALDNISFDTKGLRLVVDGRLHGHDEKFGVVKWDPSLDVPA
jgi:hypothetical protein